MLQQDIDKMLKKSFQFIPVANPTVGIEEANAVYRQVKSGWISMGKKVQEFENKVKKFVGVKNAIAKCRNEMMQKTHLQEVGEAIIFGTNFVTNFDV